MRAPITLQRNRKRKMRVHNVCIQLQRAHHHTATYVGNRSNVLYEYSSSCSIAIIVVVVVVYRTCWLVWVLYIHYSYYSYLATQLSHMITIINIHHYTRRTTIYPLTYYLANAALQYFVMYVQMFPHKQTRMKAQNDKELNRYKQKWRTEEQ